MATIATLLVAATLAGPVCAEEEILQLKAEVPENLVN
jgi:hypothetical protein